MAADRRQGLCVEVALVMALLLVLQAFFGGLSLGSMAEAQERIPGGILCGTTGPDKAGDPLDAADLRHHVADCCVLGCPMGGALPIGESARPEGPTHALSRAPLGRPSSHPALKRAELLPRRSRAPPERA